MNRVITLVVAEDHPVTRAGTVKMLEGLFGLQVVAEAEDGLQALELCRQYQPHVLLLDTRMPKMDGLMVIHLLTHRPQPPKILMFSAFDNVEMVRATLAAGASGYLLKSASSNELSEAIRRAVRGQQVFVGVQKPAQSDRPVLSGQELTTLQYIAQGLSTREIAEQMSSSTRTIETYLNRVFFKLGANNRTQAVIKAYQDKFLLID